MTEAARSSGAWFVYLLQCRGDRLYCGITNDLEARWASHVSGKGARFTRAFPPEFLLASVSVGSRSEALSLEAKIKRLPKAKKEAMLRASTR